MDTRIVLHRDVPRFTVQSLLIALDANADKRKVQECARDLLKSSFHHLFDDYMFDREETGDAMSALILAKWEVEEALDEGKKVPWWEP
jgi:hypothetical protein